MQIKYEQHPVSPERKADLRAEGFTILDIRFKPEPEEPEQETAKRPYVRKAGK